MKKVFSLVDEKRGIVQVTTDDERFYIREGRDEETGNPKHIWLPSSTWIASFVPKGIGFYKWLADKGWDEAEAIKTDRGKYGTRVHKAIELLLTGNEVAMDEELIDPYSGMLEHLNYEEYWALNTFAAWWKELTKDHTVEVITTEYSVWCQELGFAGTVDVVLKVDEEFWIIDFKTSQNVWLSHEAQLSSYKHALLLDPDMKIGNEPKLGILQIGYGRNKNGYKFNEVGDCFPLWQAAQSFWQREQGKAKPRQVDLPLKVSLAVKKDMSKGKVTKTKTKAK